MRTFNTSGQNIPEEHYTIKRQNIINKGTLHNIFLATNARIKNE